ncbi:MAG TPA: hypothetical protein VGW75_17995 [Solirubrobacteraceae bacterium]|jgi:hypothetical protein|nr:hypothetical protein [Solirubrobacteraceae bacterium]
MSIRKRAGLGLAMVVAALAAFGPTASAQAADWEIVAVDPVKLCREVQVGSTWQTVCVVAGTNKSTTNGATVAPFAYVTCDGLFTCYGIGASVGTTGFKANPYYPLPTIGGGGTVRHPGGTAGWVYADGIGVAVNTPSWCVGEPSQCPGGGIVIPTT